MTEICKNHRATMAAIASITFDEIAVVTDVFCHCRAYRVTRGSFISFSFHFHFIFISFSFHFHSIFVSFSFRFHYIFISFLVLFYWIIHCSLKFTRPWWWPLMNWFFNFSFGLICRYDDALQLRNGAIDSAVGSWIWSGAIVGKTCQYRRNAPLIINVLRTWR